MLLRQNQSQNTIVRFANVSQLKLPKPSALSMNLSATQILNAHYKTRSFTTEVAVEASPSHVTLVALSGMGTPLFTVIYNGSTVKVSHLPIPHIDKGARQALLNFILSYSPPSVLDRMLKGSGIVLKSVDKKRLFLYHKKVIVKITYQNKNPWKGHVLLENQLDHYRISIDTISVTHH